MRNRQVLLHQLVSVVSVMLSRKMLGVNQLFMLLLLQHISQHTSCLSVDEFTNSTTQRPQQH